MRIIARLNVGGPALHCTLLSQSMADYGFETVLVTGHPEEGEESYETMFGVTAQNYRLVRLPKLRRSLSGLGDLKTLWALIRLMREEKPDIVHTHTAKAGLLGRIAAFVCGVPVVVHTFHGHVLSGYFSQTVSECFRILEKILALKTQAIVTLSEGLKTELAGKFKLAPFKKFRVIPLGRPLESFFKPRVGTLRAELGLTEKEVVVGTVGRLVPIKNQALLVDAFSTLPSFMHLVIAGEGDLGGALRNQVQRLGLSQRVHFLGWRGDLENLYSSFDLFVLTSLNEGTPLSIIESFASGCPVVSTAVGGVADLFTPLDEGQLFGLGHGVERAEGVLVESQNQTELAQVLAALGRHPPLRARMGEAAQKRACDFTDVALSQRISALYQELLGGRLAPA